MANKKVSGGWALGKSQGWTPPKRGPLPFMVLWMLIEPHHRPVLKTRFVGTGVYCLRLLPVYRGNYIAVLLGDSWWQHQSSSQARMAHLVIIQSITLSTSKRKMKRKSAATYRIPTKTARTHTHTHNIRNIHSTQQEDQISFRETQKHRTLTKILPIHVAIFVFPECQIEQVEPPNPFW